MALSSPTVDHRRFELMRSLIITLFMQLFNLFYIFAFVLISFLLIINNCVVVKVLLYQSSADSFRTVKF